MKQSDNANSAKAIQPASAPATEPPAHVQVIQMATSLCISRAVYAAAHLGLADLLGDEHKSAEELALNTRTHAPSLYRLMRALASVGLFTESADHRFALTPLGATLKTDAPGAGRSTVLALAGHWMWDTWSEFMYSLQTGKTAFERVYKAVQVFLSEIVRDRDANYPRCSEFYAQASEAKFLFDDKVQNYVEDIYEQAINMHALQEQLYPSDGTVGLPVSDERSKVASDKTELMKWMVKQLPASKALFAVHMGVKQ